MTNTPPPRLHIGFKNTVTLIAQPDGPFTGWVLGGCVGGGHKTPVRFLRAVACNSMWVGILNSNKWSSSFLSHWKMEDWNFLRTSSARFWQVLARFSRWNYEKFCTYIFAVFLEGYWGRCQTRIRDLCTRGLVHYTNELQKMKIGSWRFFPQNV